MLSYQRSGFVLAKNHSSQLPRYLIAFDAETLPTQSDKVGRQFSHRFRLATATIGRIEGTEATRIKRYRFSSTAEWWAWLQSVTASNYTTWLVSHNALFDMVVCGFMDKFNTGELTVNWPRSRRRKDGTEQPQAMQSASCVIESPPTIIAAKIASNQARIVVLDTLNWFPVSLREMGERAGLPKMQMPEFSEGDEAWFGYCQRDSDILFKTFAELIKWNKDNDLGVFRYTAPSQAMSAYRHRFMQTPIYVHDNFQVKAIERLGYFGGRTEVFRKGRIDQPVFQVDVNSLFPSVMSGGRFPYMLHRYELRDDYFPLEPSIEWENSVASVRLKTREPIFPIRTKPCVIYPIGEFSAVLCGEELAYAHRKGYIQAVASWAEYRTAPLFSKWVHDLYKMRLEYKAKGDTLYADFTKRLLNAFYGKWGEKSPKWVNVPNNFDGIPWTNWVEFDPATNEQINFRMFGWQMQRKGEGEESKRSFVAISAFITAAARMRMNRLRATAGAANVYYQGVDGLIVTKPGLDAIDAAGELHNTDLGKLRLIHSADDGEIIGCSDYRLGDKVIIAGRSRALEALADGSILQRKFYAANALFNGRALTEVTESLQEWNRSSVVRKGTIRPDGWIIPYDLKPKESEPVPA